ncbi:MAG: branched-chain alpha-keto acid dehydrogenase subunit E2 [Spirochaetes bacterium]|jgi:pyruvate dehydrogenase E2 component (dihydrolipoamide acetyltransferase)|nr:branched-chain alpha-keto acid dehydrogenase subunit E2 [Spirochaetota bacterium]
MVQDVKLPEISENVEKGNVVSVMVKEGDVINEQDPILEIETEKAAVEVPSTVGGKVVEVLVAEGNEAEVGSVVIRVDTEGGEAEGASAEEPETTAEQEEAPEAEEQAEEEGAGDKVAADTGAQDSGRKAPADGDTTSADTGTAAATQPAATGELVHPRNQPVPAAPSTRMLARELGVDIHTVEGSGPKGRISQEDVKAAAKRAIQSGGGGGGATAGGGAPAGYAPLPDFSKWGKVQREKMSQVRRITAQNLTQSWVPQVTQFDKADAAQLEAFRQQYAKTADKAGVKLTVTAILLKVVSQALKRFPHFNASLDMASQEIVYKDYVHISVAVDTDRGLLVPVVRDVDKKSILTLAEELGDLAQRARAKKIKPDEMEGGTFTISNLGGIGGTGFTPVVFSPQVAILGVSRTQTEPHWNGSAFEPRPFLPLSVTYDHRLIDGADGARFLRWICQAVENPLFIDLESVPE